MKDERKYQVVCMFYGSEGIEPIFTMSLKDIYRQIEKDTDFGEALCHVFDQILGLDVYESLMFRPNLNAGQSKAIILRTI